MYYTYILYSKSSDKYYTGSTGNLQDRLLRHNQGRSKSTKTGLPWIVVYQESFNNRAEAVRREMEIKRMKSRKYIEELIGSEHPDTSGGH